MTRLFFTEKMSQERELSKAIGKEGDYFIIVPVVTGFTFKYPTYLSYKNYPYTDLSPKYEINPDNYVFSNAENKINQLKIKKMTKNGLVPMEYSLLCDFYLSKKYEDETILLKQNKLLDFIKNIDEWYIATDFDHSGCRAFELYFEVFLETHPLMLKEKKDIKKVNIMSFDDESLKKAIKKSENILAYEKSSQHLKNENVFRNKDYFNYNFNINASMIYEDLLKKIECCSDNKILTFLTIKRLISIKEGKFFYNDNIGSPISKSAMIENLEEMDLIEKAKKNQYKLTNKGIAFCKLLHPQIKKIDVDELGNDYLNLSQIEFKKKYSEILNFYFKKQKSLLVNKDKWS